MKGVWQRISAEPAVVTGAIVASINVVAAFGVWMPTPEQLAAINSALAAIFALLVRATVHHKHGTPVQLRRARSRQAREPASPPRENRTRVGAAHTPAGRTRQAGNVTMPRGHLHEPRQGHSRV
jgi:hypothetical protein